MFQKFCTNFLIVVMFPSTSKYQRSLTSLKIFHNKPNFVMIYTWFKNRLKSSLADTQPCFCISLIRSSSLSLPPYFPHKDIWIFMTKMPQNWYNTVIMIASNHIPIKIPSKERIRVESNKWWFFYSNQHFEFQVSSAKKTL